MSCVARHTEHRSRYTGSGVLQRMQGLSQVSIIPAN